MILLEFTYHLKDIDAIAASVLEHLDSKIVLVNGTMGAGKTTLINETCKQLGVKEPTSSPTYSIVNEYIGKENRSIFHFDLYRLKSEHELLDIGMLEILDSRNLCFIEWPEKTMNYLPGKHVEVKIEVTPTHRVIKITH